MELLVLPPHPRSHEDATCGTILRWHVHPGTELEKRMPIVTLQQGDEIFEYTLKWPGHGMIIHRLMADVEEIIDEHAPLALVGYPGELLPNGGIDARVLEVLPLFGTDLYLSRIGEYKRTLRGVFLWTALLILLPIMIQVRLDLGGISEPGLLLQVKELVGELTNVVLSLFMLPNFIITTLRYLLQREPSPRNVLRWKIQHAVHTDEETPTFPFIKGAWSWQCLMSRWNNIRGEGARGKVSLTWWHTVISRWSDRYSMKQLTEEEAEKQSQLSYSIHNETKGRK